MEATTMSERAITDVALFCRLWHDRSLTSEDIARRLGVSPPTVSAMGRRHLGLPRRERPPVPAQEPPPVDEEEDLASCESLRLAPTVAAAAAEVRAKWTEQERYNRRVQRVQPVEAPCYSAPWMRR